MNGTASRRWIGRLSRWCLYGVLAVPLVYVPDVLFPFVTTRVAVFRVLVGTATAGALWLAMERGEWRGLGRDPVAAALGLFLVAGLVSSLLGPSPWRSVFGSLERMEGWIGWLHYGAFYVALRLLFGDRQWRRWLRGAVAVGGLLAATTLAQQHVELWPEIGRRIVYGIRPESGGRVAATMNQVGSLGGYLVAALGAAGLVAARDGARWWRRAALLAAVLELWALWAAGSEAALAGAAVGAAAALLWWGAERRSRPAAAAAGAALAGGTAAFLAAGLMEGAQLGWLPGAEGLAESVLSDSNLRSRLYAWEAGWEALRAHPALGMGLENFTLAYERYFDAAAYGAGGELFWDRAHNAFLGAAVTTGAVGGLAHAGVYAAAVWNLRRGVSRGALGLAAGAVAAGAVLGYAAYLVFWFEEPNSFPLLLSLAAFGGWAASGAGAGGGEGASGGAADGEGPSGRSNGDAPPEGGGWPKALRRTVAGLLLVALAASVQHHARLWAAARITGRAGHVDSLERRVEMYHDALDLRPPGTQEIAGVYATFLLELRPQLPEIRRSRSAARATQRGVQRALEVMRAEVSRDSANARILGIQGSLYDLAYQLSGQERLHEWSVRSFRQAIRRAPNRVRLYRVLADVHLRSGNAEQAVGVLAEALDIRPDGAELHFRMAAALLAAGRHDAALGELRAASRLGLDLGAGSRRPVVRRLREHFADTDPGRTSWLDQWLPSG